MANISNTTDELGNEEGIVGVQSPIKSNISYGNYSFGTIFKEFFPPGLMRKVISETVATYLLVFATCGAAAISASDERRISQLGQSIVGGLIVTVMIYAVGHISGAHMNPAVTIAFATFRHFPWKQVPFYAAAQFTGATCSAFTLRALLQPIKHIGTTSPSGTHIQSFVMEIVVTFIMMFVTNAVATDSKAIGELAGLAVGSSVCITSVLAGPVSGGSMNPARTLGPALASAHYKGLWIYFTAPVIGTLLGSWAYHIIRVTDKPVQAISAKSFSLRLRRLKSRNEDSVDKNIDSV